MKRDVDGTADYENISRWFTKKFAKGKNLDLILFKRHTIQRIT